LGFLGSRLPLCSPLAMSLSLVFFDAPIECKCLVGVRLDQQRASVRLLRPNSY